MGATVERHVARAENRPVDILDDAFEEITRLRKSAATAAADTEQPCIQILILRGHICY
jgi:hypothetical protein